MRRKPAGRLAIPREKKCISQTIDAPQRLDTFASTAAPKYVTSRLVRATLAGPFKDMTPRRIERRLRSAAGALLLWAAGCAASQHTQPRLQRPALSFSATASSEFQRPSGGQRHLYPVDEALRDVLSGELVYMGTGHWPGIERSYACAFRNQRILVVNTYCTLKEAPAFRLDVYSPERGRVSIYAEARGGVSTHDRTNYFIFTAASAPAPGPETRIQPVALAMSYQDLQRHERERYGAFLPSCYGGMRHDQKEGTCFGPLAPEATAWAARNRAFLEHASDDWYRVVRAMRALAELYGRDPD
jgi:hypothetical protein